MYLRKQVKPMKHKIILISNVPLVDFNILKKKNV